MRSFPIDTLSDFVPALVGFAIGFAIERLALPRLSHEAERRGWRTLGAVIAALGGNALIVWATVPGLSSVLVELPHDRSIANDQHALAVLSIFAAVVVLARLAGTAVDELMRRTPLPSATLFRSIASGLVYVVGSLVALESIGISIVPLLETLGVGGLAVALALRDTLANLFAGLQIIASRQVRPGDFVKIDAVEGMVADVTWRNTTVRDLANALVIVPNEKLASAIVTNYSLREKTLVVEIQIGVAYESDLDRVERIALDVAYDVVPRIGDAAAPYVRFRRFGDSKIELSVFFMISAYSDQFALRSDYLKALQARYRKEGVAMVPFASPSAPMPLKKAQGGTRTLYDG